MTEPSLSKPPADMSDAELISVLRQLEEQVPALERALERFMELYEECAAERDKRISAYTSLAEVLGVDVSEVDR